ncbi:hypothetical protein EW145_g4635 [Phellinidium pouzarii]|uniref:Uncharacterized protein n=1 Tax=Phellinidium pouzarii TaxID=167371 RepID=A0A4V3XCG1_9AGAM|nr:hypothetical protein EW145_g4635 [Phellinidium pouzarii]
MCIGLWSLDHPDYALLLKRLSIPCSILCTNRDEYLSRPTVNAQFHSFGRVSESSFVLSGRDIQAGGSWFGINRDGRVALLTNITEQHGSYRSSRGHLVSSFLQPGTPNVVQYTRELTSNRSDEFAGFNLLLLSPSGETGNGSIAYSEASLVTNSGGGGVITARNLRSEERRLGGVSNGVDGPDGATWPKVKKGVSCLGEIIFENEGRFSSSEELAEQLFNILSYALISTAFTYCSIDVLFFSFSCFYVRWKPSTPPGNRSQLRTSIEIPPLRMSSSLSADASADGPEFYGTRLSTILLVRRDGRVIFMERDAWKLDKGGNAVRGDPKDTRIFHLQLNDPKELKESGIIS